MIFSFNITGQFHDLAKNKNSWTQNYWFILWYAKLNSTYEYSDYYIYWLHFSNLVIVLPGVKCTLCVYYYYGKTGRKKSSTFKNERTGYFIYYALFAFSIKERKNIKTFIFWFWSKDKSNPGDITNL